MRRRVAALLAAAILVFLPQALLAQGNLGAITGVVTDSSGGVVPEAAIKTTQISTGVTSTVKTSTAGYYRLPLPPGTYRMEASREGFKTAVADSITVGVAQVVTVDFKLEVGSTAQSVIVTGEAPLLQTSTPEVGSSITATEFATLPLLVDDGGRQLQSFIFRSLPGAVGDEFAGSLNGGQLFSADILIDGLPIARYDIQGGSLIEVTPSADAASEFKVQMSSYSAEYGDTGGGIANFGMKSGTNVYHGSLYEYFQNSVLDATGYDTNILPPGNPQKVKAPLRQNNFGGTFGGPINLPRVYNGKDRSFFFLDIEENRYRKPTPGGFLTLPTNAMRQGDFSALLDTSSPIGTDALGRPVFAGEIYDPTTSRMANGKLVRDGFGFDPVTGLPTSQANIIPPAEFSKATALILPLFPNVPNDRLINNFPSLRGCCPRLDVDRWSLKIDQVVNPKHRLSSFFNYSDRTRFNERSRHTWPPIPSFPLDPIKQQIVNGRIFRLSEDWTVNDHTLNHLALGYNRARNFNGFTPTQGWPSKLGITGVADQNFPFLTFDSKSRLGPYSVNGNSDDPAESYIGQETLSYLRGKHNWKFGAEYIHYRYNVRINNGISGSFNFSQLQTALPGKFQKKTGRDFASFILGAVNSASRAVISTNPGYRQGLLSFYAQDDWKVSPKLTLNYGLRWEIPGPKKEAFDRMSGFDPTVPNPGADGFPGAYVFLGQCQGCNGRSSFEDRYYKEFAPRFGFAYAITRNLVFRGGYGLSYSPPIESHFGDQNDFGFNGAVSLNHSVFPTPFENIADPVIYWTPLSGAALPAGTVVGVPPFAGTLPVRTPDVANGNDVDFLPRQGLHLPYVQNWNLGFQYQLPGNVVLEANYVGSKGTRLLAFDLGGLYNQAPSKYMALGDILGDDFATDLADPVNGPILASFGVTKLPYPSFSGPVNQGLRPFPQYTAISNNAPGFGNSTYHSFQLTARKQAGHGLDFIAAYTWSKTLSNADSAIGYYGGYFQNFYNQKAEKSITSFDFPQVVKLTWIYELPVGKGKRFLSSARHLDALVGGWKVTAIQQYRSGDPLQVYDNNVSDGVFGGGVPRLDLLPGVPEKVPFKGPLDPINGTQYLNPNAFADPPLSASGTFALRYGTSSRFLNKVRGPGQQTEDFGVLKDFRITERVGLLFRADFFNVFNRTGLADPDTNLADGLPSQGGTFGTITDVAQGPRTIQLSLRLNF